jgi:hypothetical protein
MTETEERYMVTYSDLSPALKVLVVGCWIMLALYVIIVITEIILGVISA